MTVAQFVQTGAPNNPGRYSGGLKILKPPSSLQGRAADDVGGHFAGAEAGLRHGLELPYVAFPGPAYERHGQHQVVVVALEKSGLGFVDTSIHRLCSAEVRIR